MFGRRTGAVGRLGNLGSGSRGPRLDLNFSVANQTTIDSRLTFTRAAGASTYYDATGTMQVAATNAPRIDYGPTPGGVTNWVLASAAVGSLGTSNITYTPNATVAPDGTTTASLLTETTANSQHLVTTQFQRNLISGDIITLSGYFKASGTSTAGFTANGEGTSSFDLQAVSSAHSGTCTATTITAVGNGWFRCTATFTKSNSVPNIFLNVSGNFGSYVGSISTSVYAWGWQGEYGVSTASAYVPTGASVPANSGATPLGLLIEEARTNSIRNNTANGAVVGTPGTYPTNWANIQNTGLIPNVIGFGTENGVNYIDLQYSGTTAVGTQNQLVFDTGVIAASPGQAWTFSSYFRLVAGSLTGVQINLLGGDNIAGQTSPNITTITSAPLATQRTVFSFTTNAGAVTSIRDKALIFTFAAAPVAVNFTLRVGLPQIEQGAFVTSAIPTSTVTVTRALDAASMSPTPWLNTSAGTLEAEAIIPAALSAQNSEVVSLGASGSDALILRTLLTSGSAQAVSFVANANKGSISTANGVGSNTAFKSALTYDNTTLGVSVILNSSAIVTGVVTGLPVLTPLILGAGRGAPLNGYLRRTRYWPRVLSNTELVVATSGDSPSLDLNFASNTAIDSRITFTRASVGTFFNSSGNLQSAAINAPRIDYGPAPAAGALPLGLLVEEARTNSIRNNTGVGAVVGSPGTLPTNWVNNIPAGLTVNVIGTGTENGISYIDIQWVGTTSGTSIALSFESNSAISAVQNQTFTTSFYVKLVGGSLTNITALQVGAFDYTAATGFIGTNTTNVASPTAAALATQRVSASWTIPDATAAFMRPFIGFACNTTSAVNMTIRIGLPQTELGAFATSPIQTSSVAVTRAIEVANMPASTSWYIPGAPATLGVEAQQASAHAQAVVALSLDTPGLVNRTSINVQASNAVAMWDTPTSLNTGLGTPTAGAIWKAAYAFTNGAQAGSLNGAAVVTNTVAGLTTGITTLSIGNAFSLQQFNGWLRRARYWPRIMPNTELQSVTT